MVSGCYLPGNLLNDLPVFFHLVFMTTHEVESKFPHFYQGENSASEEWSNTRQNTGLIKSKVEI